MLKDQIDVSEDPLMKFSNSQESKAKSPTEVFLPKTNIVSDDADIDLNKSRFDLHNIRKERFQSWGFDVPSLPRDHTLLDHNGMESIV
jgi:predicted ferric reductase